MIIFFLDLDGIVKFDLLIFINYSKEIFDNDLLVVFVKNGMEGYFFEVI